MPADLAQLAGLLERLDPEQAELFLEAIQTRSQRRDRRLGRRDAAIREALALMIDRGARSEANAAAELDRRLRQYLAAASWKADRHMEVMPDGSDALRVLLHRILRLNEGRSRGLGWEQLRRVGRGVRTPDSWA